MYVYRYILHILFSHAHPFLTLQLSRAGPLPARPSSPARCLWSYRRWLPGLGVPLESWAYQPKVEPYPRKPGIPEGSYKDHISPKRQQASSIGDPENQKWGVQMDLGSPSEICRNPEPIGATISYLQCLSYNIIWYHYGCFAKFMWFTMLANYKTA